MPPPSDLSGDDRSDAPGARGAAVRRGRPAAAWEEPHRPRHLRWNGSTDPSTGQAEIEHDDDDDEARPARRWRRTILEWVGVIGGGIAIALLVEAFLIQAFWIPSPSMAPTLEVGDRVLVNKLSYRLHDVHRGDVVVFERPPDASNGEGDGIKDLIKRVVAIGGDTVEARDGVVFVNGQILDEPYLEPGTSTNDLERQTIPADHVFVMGDNRTNSQDSRIFGAIAEDDIVGRAFVRVLPITDLTWL